MKIEIDSSAHDFADGDKLYTQVKITGAEGVYCDGTPLVLAYELELWKEMAKQAALMMSSMIGSHQGQMTRETIHEALKLKQCILNGTPEDLEWVVAAAQKAIKLNATDGS